MIGYIIYAGLSVASPFVGRRKAFLWSFAAFLMLFVALRFETGFDWPVYKMLFAELQAQFTGFNASCFSENYDQELLFVVLLGGLSQLFNEYEVPQAIFSLFFLASIFCLGRAFKLSNVSLFVALALSYIILTVGFSTVRQSLAIAAFNFAIVMYFNRRHFACATSLVLCLLFQYSAVMYVFAFLIAVATSRRFRSAWVDVGIFIVLAVGALIGSAAFLYLVKSGVIVGSERVSFYVKMYLMRGINTWDILFSVVLIGISGHAIFSVLHSDRSDREILASRMMVTLAALAVGALLIPVVRERASYEMWVLYSVILCTRISALRNLAIATAFGFAASYAALVGFRGPALLMFHPYQNYLIERFSSSKYPPRQYDKFITAVENNLKGSGRGKMTSPSPAVQRDQKASQLPTVGQDQKVSEPPTEEQKEVPQVSQDPPRRKAC